MIVNDDHFGLELCASTCKEPIVWSLEQLDSKTFLGDLNLDSVLQRGQLGRFAECLTKVLRGPLEGCGRALDVGRGTGTGRPPPCRPLSAPGSTPLPGPVLFSKDTGSRKWRMKVGSPPRAALLPRAQALPA